jgi:dTDP-4-amino-4,6-dideoxy-D-galactose acyltransferase
MSDPLCCLLPWDSQFWGYPVARLNATTLTPDAVEQIREWCQERAVRCLYFAACGTCAATLSLASEEQFRFVDLRVELACPATGYLAAPGRPSAGVRRAKPGDRVPLQQLARTAHRETRFFKDARFDRSQCEELYAAWIARDLDSHAVLTCDEADGIEGVGGYVTCEQTADPEVGRIGLLAVAPRLRGRGFGRTLLAAAFEHFRSGGVARLEVATQGTNVSALRLYQAAGFQPERVRVWFHKWFW